MDFSWWVRECHPGWLASKWRLFEKKGPHDQWRGIGVVWHIWHSALLRTGLPRAPGLTYLPPSQGLPGRNPVMVTVALWLPLWAAGVLASLEGYGLPGRDMVVGCLERLVRQDGTIRAGMDSLGLAFGLVCLSRRRCHQASGSRRSLPGLTVALVAPGECQLWWLKFQAVSWNSGRVCAM